MASFTVKSQELQRSEDGMDRMAQKLDSIRGRVDSIRNSLAFQIASSSSIRARLRAVSNDVYDERRGMKKMSQGLEQCRKKYSSTENRICSKAKSGNNIMDILIEKVDILIPAIIPGCPAPSGKDLLDIDKIKDAFDKYFKIGDKQQIQGVLEQIQKIIYEKINSLRELEKFLGYFMPTSSQPGMNNNGIKDKLDWKDLLLVGITGYDAINAFMKEMDDFKGEFLDGIVDKTTIKGSANASWKYWDASYEGEYGSAGVTVLAADAYASAEAGLMTKTEDGKLLFNPHIDAEAGVSFSALYADAEVHIGDDMYGAYANGNVTVGEVNANAKASVGLFDENGEIDPRLKASASAEAIAVEAKAEAGVTVLGTEAKVEAGVNVGIGAHADVGYEDGVFSLDIGASLGIGASIAFEIDIGGTIDAVKKKAKSGLLSWLRS